MNVAYIADRIPNKISASLDLDLFVYRSHEKSPEP